MNDYLQRYHNGLRSNQWTQKIQTIRVFTNTVQAKAGKGSMETPIASSHDVIYEILLKKDQEAEIAHNSIEFI